MWVVDHLPASHWQLGKMVLYRIYPTMFIIFKCYVYALIVNCTTDLCEIWTFSYILLIFSLVRQATLFSQLLSGTYKLLPSDYPKVFY